MSTRLLGEVVYSDLDLDFETSRPRHNQSYLYSRAVLLVIKQKDSCCEGARIVEHLILTPSQIHLSSA